MIAIALDCLESDRNEEKHEASRFFDQLHAGEHTVLMLREHLDEILSIDDEASARRRLSVVSKIKRVATFAPVDVPCGLAKATDVLLHEHSVAGQSDMSLGDIRDRVRASFLNHIDGEEAVWIHDYAWRAFRNGIHERKRAHSDHIAWHKGRISSDKSMKLSTYLASRIADRSAIQGNLRASLKRDIASLRSPKADRWTGDGKEFAKETYVPIMSISYEDGVAMIEKERDLARSYLARYGDEATLDEFRTHKIVSEVIGELWVASADRPRISPIVRVEKLPSRRVYDAVRRYHRLGGKWKGSEFVDWALAGAAIYADIGFVDGPVRAALTNACIAGELCDVLVRNVQKSRRFSTALL